METPVGRIGTLICWESYMPLVRYALYAQGIDVYVTPTYDSGDRTVATDIPDGFPGGGELFPGRTSSSWTSTRAPASR